MRAEQGREQASYQHPDGNEDDRSGIAAIDHLIMIMTIRQNGTSISRMVTGFPAPLVMDIPLVVLAASR
jgi:hypothetical protein